MFIQIFNVIWVKTNIPNFMRAKMCKLYLIIYKLYKGGKVTAHNEIKRDKRIVMMVTEEEREAIKDIASRTAYKTLSNFCRQVIFQVCDLLEDQDINETTLVGFVID